MARKIERQHNSQRPRQRCGRPRNMQPSKPTQQNRRSHKGRRGNVRVERRKSGQDHAAPRHGPPRTGDPVEKRGDSCVQPPHGGKGPPAQGLGPTEAPKAKKPVEDGEVVTVALSGGGKNGAENDTGVHWATQVDDATATGHPQDCVPTGRTAPPTACRSATAALPAPSPDAAGTGQTTAPSPPDPQPPHCPTGRAVERSTRPATRGGAAPR